MSEKHSEDEDRYEGPSAPPYDPTGGDGSYRYVAGDTFKGVANAVFIGLAVYILYHYVKYVSKPADLLIGIMFFAVGMLGFVEMAFRNRDAHKMHIVQIVELVLVAAVVAVVIIGW